MLTNQRRGSLELFVFKHLKSPLPLFAASCLFAFLPACALDYGPGTTAPEGDSDTASVDTETVDTEDTPVDAGDAPHLSETHVGWQKTSCLDCHKGDAYPHEDEDLSPPNCGVCHGYNGAVHTDHASLDNPSCDSCHNSETVPHFDDFTFPDDCVQCHNHPDSPEGL